MRPSLRRSCAACARSKLSCDLLTPRCSRCAKRNTPCAYANEPLTARPATSAAAFDRGSELSSMPPAGLSIYRYGSLDPFNSWPQTRLPREHVQRLIHSFLSKIAFQYYPLDLSATSNPFLVSWWPLALGDPALFHVSLQTACLDEELLAQKGFRASELLMADSVALLRRKIEDLSLAVQDGTINSVIILAAIEFGKGNTTVSNVHVDGVKELISMRGGISAVRQTSPLTARMVSWVTMLVTGHPQFETQDDVGIGDGIPPIPEWQFEPTPNHACLSELGGDDIDHAVKNVFLRLRNVFQRAQRIPLPPTRFHDLACFVIHRLLFSVLEVSDDKSSSSISECLRHAMILYMFIIQGPTYFPHAVMMNTIAAQFVEQLKRLESIPRSSDSLDVWLLSIGVVASVGTANLQWLMDRARKTAASMQLNNWDDVLVHMKWILWLDLPKGENIFRAHWEPIFGAASRPGSSELRALDSTMLS